MVTTLITLDIETLIVMNEGIYPDLLTMLEATALIIGIFAIAGFAISLSGIAWLCFEEIRQPPRRQMKPMTEPPEPDEYDLLAVLTALDDNLSDNLTGGAARPAPGVTTDFSRVSQAFAATELESVAAPGDRRPLVNSLKKPMLAPGHTQGGKRSGGEFQSENHHRGVWRRPGFFT
jgi:hypothetical protein